MIKTTTAQLDIEVVVDCPHCNCRIDLLDPAQTDGYDHNEEGYILDQAFPDWPWTDSHRNFTVEEAKCTECEKTFDVKGLEW